jgi:hypothetical protein
MADFSAKGAFYTAQGIALGKIPQHASTRAEGPIYCFFPHPLQQCRNRFGCHATFAAEASFLFRDVRFFKPDPSSIVTMFTRNPGFALALNAAK